MTLPYFRYVSYIEHSRVSIKSLSKRICFTVVGSCSVEMIVGIVCTRAVSIGSLVRPVGKTGQIKYALDDLLPFSGQSFFLLDECAKSYTLMLQNLSVRGNARYSITCVTQDDRCQYSPHLIDLSTITQAQFKYMQKTLINPCKSSYAPTKQSSNRSHLVASLSVPVSVAIFLS